LTYNVLIGSKTFGKITPEPEKILTENGCHVIHNPYPDFFREDQLIQAIEEIDAMVVGFDEITEKVIANAHRLKVFAKHGVGVDNIDIDAATNYGKIVCNTVGANENGVADLVFGLMISIARQIPFADREIKNGGWPKIFGSELWEKTLGIVGLGRIGKGVARRARGFEMKILAYDVCRDNDFAYKYNVQFVELDELLKNSDFISIHTPLNANTKNLIGEKQLKMMKPQAYLVNTARGEIVDEEALQVALRDKWIAGAALDAFAVEPATGTKILEADALVATPHMGAYTKESLNRMSLMCSQSIVSVFKGEKPQYIVNPEVYNLL